MCSALPFIVSVRSYAPKERACFLAEMRCIDSFLVNSVSVGGTEDGGMHGKQGSSFVWICRKWSSVGTEPLTFNYWGVLSH
jgi:hypothetical protein